MPLYMRKDDHGYKFLRPIPKELVPLLGKANFAKRLGKDRSAANSACAALTLQTDIELAAAREQVPSPSEEQELEAFLRKKPKDRRKKVVFSDALVGQICTSWMLQVLSADSRSRAEGMDDAEFEEKSATLREVLPAINHALATGQVDGFAPSISQWIDLSGYDFDATDAQWQRLIYEVLKTYQRSYKIIEARQQGEQLEPPDWSKLPPPLRRIWQKEPKPIASPSVMRLSDFTPEYEKQLEPLSDKECSTKLHCWQLFIAFTDDKPLAEVTSADIFNFFESRLKDPDKPWSHAYASKRIKKGFSEAFALAKAKAYISTNPVANLEVLPRTSAKKEDRHSKPRYPFNTPQLNALFASTWYDPNSDALKGRLHHDLGARYWIPLLAMWHGLRVVEAAQLQLHDVDITEAVLHIQDSPDGEATGPERGLKNKATMRDVPIHPVLLQLGFMDFVRKVQTHYDSGPLFPSSLPSLGSKSPKWGGAYIQAFLRHLHTRLLLSAGYCSHSFRHGFEDQIREAQVEQPWPKGMASSISGRASVRAQDASVIEAEGSEKHYEKGYTLAAKRKFISLISYPGVQLPVPFASWLESREPFSSSLLTHVRQWEERSQKQ